MTLAFTDWFIVGLSLVVSLLASVLIIVLRRHRCCEHHCEHVWKVTGGYYYHKDQPFETSGFVNPRLINELLYGVTVLTERCQARCGITRNRRLVGRAKLPDGLRYDDSSV